MFRIFSVKQIDLAAGIRKYHWVTNYPKEWSRPKKKFDSWHFPGWWIEDHYPRKLPETPEQRRTSARKYGLREGDYEPLPYDSGMGEYPDLGLITHGMRDPYENWNDIFFKRNFGEPMDIDFLLYIPTRIEYTGTEHHTMLAYALKFSFYVVLGTLIFIYASSTGPEMFVPMLSKQYPLDYDRAFHASDPLNYPLTHYSFESAEDE